MQNKFEQVLIRENQFLNNLNYNSLNNLSSTVPGNNYNYMTNTQTNHTNSQFYPTNLPSANSTKNNFNSTVGKSTIPSNMKIEDEKIRKNINEQLDYV